MKRHIIGTVLWLVVVVIDAVIALHGSIVFWLLALSVCLYSVFGRRAELELRMGVGTRKSQRRLYAAVIWQRHSEGAGESQVEEVELEGVRVEERT
ncbi:MAG: hypothetical protein ACRD06_06610 [Terriglobia bacterium]